MARQEPGQDPRQSGWTGGQYSLLRGLLGLSVTGVAAGLLAGGGALVSPPAAPGEPLPAFLRSPAMTAALLAATAVLGLLLAVGVADRGAALGLWGLGITLVLLRPALWTAGVPFLGWVLLAHSLTPPAPYGSWSARGRPDPAGGWRMPLSISRAAWWALAVAYAALGAGRLAGATGVPGGSGTLGWGAVALAELFLAGLATIGPLRPLVWALALAFEAPLLIAAGEWGVVWGLLFVHLLAFDPAWVPPRQPGSTELLFYDGACGLCHRAVRFVLAEDRRGDAFRFAPLFGETFRRQIPEDRREALPDSLVLQAERGRLLVRSRAVLHLLSRLGGLWRPSAAAARLIPPPLSDLLYTGVARVRHRLFARPAAVCPITPPELRTRFDP